MRNWLLPEYIQDVLPEEAWRIELMRAQVLDLLRKSGYELVAPPLMEYAESLLLDGNLELDLRTFKLVDQLSGRTMAVRADITPQVARIDAHLLNRQGVARLCYAGNVLHTQPIGLTRTRELLQIGAELYGHPGLASDLEIQQLMLQSLALLGINNVHLDLGHVGVLRALMRDIELDKQDESALFIALLNKDLTTLQALTQTFPSSVRDALLALPSLYGESADVLARARNLLPSDSQILLALDEMERVAGALRSMVGSIGIDLADLRGYHYHSGIVFAAYHAGDHDAIALGGRYDGLGKSFGRSRCATGFSMDLRQLYRLLPSAAPRAGICAPAVANDDALNTEIARLREAGETVVVDLLGDEALRGELQCDRELVLRNGAWQVVTR
ncbi:MAG: ATP phosphoribosyltransferase regulatory subunit [Gallionella sp.]|nr:ATP phosphoribosyltransferase regulatory subunit [Gallionella sp.]